MVEVATSRLTSISLCRSERGISVGAQRTHEPAMGWVELHNHSAVDLGVSGWKVSGDLGSTFPASSRLTGWGIIALAWAQGCFSLLQ